MTHDWFSPPGRRPQREGVHERRAAARRTQKLGCRPGDRIDKALVAESGEPGKFTHEGKEYLERAPKTFANNVTAWWDASQIYGYDERSRKRVKRDPADRAKLLDAQRACCPPSNPATRSTPSGPARKPPRSPITGPSA